MFETILEQPAVVQLASDLSCGTIAPSMLFAGPTASGKGSTGLELARIRSCERNADKDCTCYACNQHRLLSHPDLLVLGPRSFSAEIAVSANAFKRNPSPEGRLLFIRSVRKLLIRFAPVLWEDDPKFGKLTSMIVTLREDLDDFLGKTSTLDSIEKRDKRCETIKKNALKLEEEGIAESIPVGHIRCVSYWSHLAPTGKEKLLLIENADRMQDAARNSLLKMLEEPPAKLIIVLTSTREKALLQTILSRVRPYRFVQRPASVERILIQQVFSDSFDESPDSQTLSSYFESSLPVKPALVSALAAFFVAATAISTAHTIRRQNKTLPEDIIALGKFTVTRAENAGLGRPPDNNIQQTITTVITGAENFAIRGLFLHFLKDIRTIVLENYRLNASSPSTLASIDIWHRYTAEAAAAVGTYNQTPVAALERLFTSIRQALVQIQKG
jgi:DNA polymerase-3 subunit gamma/tau